MKSECLPQGHVPKHSVYPVTRIIESDARPESGSSHTGWLYGRTILDPDRVASIGYGPSLARRGPTLAPFCGRAEKYDPVRRWFTPGRPIIQPAMPPPLSIRILGIGVDILDSRRIRRLLLTSTHRHSRLTSRILSSAELTSQEFEIACRSPDLSTLVQFLSNRWTAKEAAYKALYPTLKPMWKQLSVLKDDAVVHKPRLVLQDAEGQEVSGVTLHLSLSHDGHNTVATVLACTCEDL